MPYCTWMVLDILLDYQFFHELWVLSAARFLTRSELPTFIQDGHLPIISRVITPLIGVVTPVSPFTTSRGPWAKTSPIISSLHKNHRSFYPWQVWGWIIMGIAGYLEDQPRTCKLLWTLVIVVVPEGSGWIGPLPNGRTSWLINRGDPNHLLTGMILQADSHEIRLQLNSHSSFENLDSLRWSAHWAFQGKLCFYHPSYSACSSTFPHRFSIDRWIDKIKWDKIR